MTARVIVIGGGISGLAAAHRLVELRSAHRWSLDIVLLERSPRLGGTIATERLSGFLVEVGPDSFITEKPWALELCDRLGIAGQLIPTRSADQAVYVVRDGALHRLPEGFSLLAPTRVWPLIRSPLFSWAGKLRMMMEPFVPCQSGDGDESLGSFVRRRLGTEVLERVAQPLVGGIYAADPEKLSLAATMPRFLDMERSGGGLIRSLWREHRRRVDSQKAASGARWNLFFTLQQGMEGLVEAISRRIPGESVHLGVEVTRIEKNGSGAPWTVYSSTGSPWEADAVILALPAFLAGGLLSGQAPVLAEDLCMIPYASTATISLGYRRDDFPHPFNAFGFLVPAVEARMIFACTFSSVKFPDRAPEGMALIRVFLGGALQPHLLKQKNREMIITAREELAALLGVRASPVLSVVHRHDRAMPQYHLGHGERVNRIEAQLHRLPGLGLAGNAYRGVGIPDCVHSGERAAERILRQLGLL